MPMAGLSAQNGGVVAFWLKDGVNLRTADPFYGLFREALHLASIRPILAFCFADATVNQDCGKEVKYLRKFERATLRANTPDERVDQDPEIIHLPEVVVRVGRRLEAFRDCLFEAVGEAMGQLEQRAVVAPVVAFSGLADALLLLMGTHHGWSEEARAVGLVIIDLMRQALKDLAANGRQHALLSVVDPRQLPWVRPRCRYGLEAWGVKDPFAKIAAEAPFHRYCDGGHVTIIRWDRRRPVRQLEELLLYAREQDAGCVWPC